MAVELGRAWGSLVLGAGVPAQGGAAGCAAGAAQEGYVCSPTSAASPLPLLTAAHCHKPPRTALVSGIR